MDRRARIGFLFSYNEDWIAGTYYILNIIHALAEVAVHKQPEIVIISDDYKNFLFVKENSNYKKLDFFEYPIKLPTYSLFERALNKFGKLLGFSKLINKPLPVLNVDFIYPFSIDQLNKNRGPIVNWIPDFQDLYFPENFPETSLNQRRQHRAHICEGDWVVFSSLDAKKDFEKEYTKAAINKYVLPFAVTLPEFERLDLDSLIAKYKLPLVYFFAPNQFWIHKNHMVILKAIKYLNDKGILAHVAFSGKEYDHRNAEYVRELKDFVDEAQINDRVHFLGFIPRDEQVALMNNSRAIIQASKFEGWSTVVEEAKALNQFLLVSDINVHREQINTNCMFFAPDDYKLLSSHMYDLLLNKPQITRLDYSENIRQFGENFMGLVSSIDRSSNV